MFLMRTCCSREFLVGGDSPQTAGQTVVTIALLGSAFPEDLLGRFSTFPTELPGLQKYFLHCLP